MGKSKFIKGQLVSEEISIGISKITIRAAENFFKKPNYAIVINQEKRCFIHSKSKDLQNIMQDFTKLCTDYKTMIKESKKP